MLKKIFRITIDLLFVAIFLILSLFVLMKIFGGTQSVFGYNIYYVMTGSMEPKYSSGDILLGKTANPDRLETGDVITYMGDEGEITDKIITHQIIEIREENGKRRFITQGLANNLPDPPVDEHQIHSKIICKIPLLGLVFSLANQKWGFFTVVVLPLAFLVVSEVVSLVKLCKMKEKEENDDEADSATH